jgi:serine/threonine protein kinase
MYIPGYEILKQIGQGGMSTVYLALQKSLLRKVALKVLSPALVADPIFCERFLKEGKIIAQLSHPHIVSIIDIGHHKETYYMSMEYIDGGDLKKQIRSGINIERTVHIILQIARALGYAHDRGFVHRDVKPQNILFKDNDTAILTDFGIAKSIGDSDAGDLTRIGQAFGSPRYMSPEQVRGKDLNFRSDLYSLGILLYEMLSGNPPYSTNDAAATARMHLIKPVPKLPNEVAKYQKIINNLLAKTPDERYANAWELIVELQEVANDVGELTYDDTVEMEFNDKSTEIMSDNAIEAKEINQRIQSEAAIIARDANHLDQKSLTATISRPKVATSIRPVNKNPETVKPQHSVEKPNSELKFPKNKATTAKFLKTEQKASSEPENPTRSNKTTTTAKLNQSVKKSTTEKFISHEKKPDIPAITKNVHLPHKKSSIKNNDIQSTKLRPSSGDTPPLPLEDPTSWVSHPPQEHRDANLSSSNELPILKFLLLLLAIAASILLILQFGTSPKEPLPIQDGYHQDIIDQAEKNPDSMGQIPQLDKRDDVKREIEKRDEIVEATIDSEHHTESLPESPRSQVDDTMHESNPQPTKAKDQPKINIENDPLPDPKLKTVPSKIEVPNNEATKIKTHANTQELDNILPKTNTPPKPQSSSPSQAPLTPATQTNSQQRTKPVTQGSKKTTQETPTRQKPKKGSARKSTEQTSIDPATPNKPIDPSASTKNTAPFVERPKYTTPILDNTPAPKKDRKNTDTHPVITNTVQPPQTIKPTETPAVPQSPIDSAIIKMNGRYIISPDFEKALKAQTPKVTRLRNGSLKLSFPLKRFFPTNLQLSKEAKQELEKVAFVLRNYTGYSITVIDRSRLEGQPSDGLELDRAKQVSGFLVAQNFNPERIHAIRDNPRYASSPRHGLEIFLAPSAFRFFSK